MDGGDPGLAALRLIEGYIFFCVAHQVPPPPQKKKPAEKTRLLFWVFGERVFFFRRLIVGYQLSMMSYISNF